jgi:hypothetical protein
MNQYKALKKIPAEMYFKINVKIVIHFSIAKKIRFDIVTFYQSSNNKNHAKKSTLFNVGGKGYFTRKQC